TRSNRDWSSDVCSSDLRSTILKYFLYHICTDPGIFQSKDLLPINNIRKKSSVTHKPLIHYSMTDTSLSPFINRCLFIQQPIIKAKTEQVSSQFSFGVPSFPTSASYVVL